ncbi:DMT family transporter [Paenibacillus physcomitrellae]|uniref:QacE family quaternary ammonium compound efflux SMR transporter n=1 Tax=Paenibacillus physcomitrellae TaxID=1619311 RepID=A0ABQ1GG08_9BACL|nr:multidrug efflux SMR transporter [Paenibacillus physcomitrellae]GGA42749.1 QacE family quaternary ammonium compound efflux SMR transporter [Paenibacillus physcomitrellae]
MAWIFLVLAGCCEVLGVIGMNRIVRRRAFSSYLLMFGSFAGSFALLSSAMGSLPMGTAYAVWTGIGTVGSALVGMFLYGESRSWPRMLCIAVILASAVGLKLIT